MFIEIKNAKKQYGTGEAAVFALAGVDLTLDKGKVYVILGPSGSGKSTLLNMVGGLDCLDSGDLIVDGRNIAAASKKELLQYRLEDVGFIFQFYNLIPDLNVEENIQVVSEISPKPLDIDEVLKSLEIEQYRKRFPKELSGGQQQRVAIGRAMIKNPKLLLCDELTGALDTKSSYAVLKFVEKMNQMYGTTIIIITHNEAIADMADCVIRFKDGNVASKVDNTNKCPAEKLNL
ncbi:MAG: ABC transporter ATP-binding protein [Ruminococcus sp.]|uniref:ABC transporter ATP-binding protein n=1 Tax=uncultured Ruminococcus sp. TaxID=165186 RepID=UPI0015666894|nr:ABC transporter ATP-binding protein [uncultured Ruminococcus sp.]MCR4863059.1 ABC transporter ATP-binding protein [Ruminococcus sp.]